MDVSIIILNYNSNKLLDDCLSSLIKHTCGINYEIIVIDNGSYSEPSEKVITKYQGITLIKLPKNITFAAANNKGINIAKGKYSLILNDDTIFTENTVEKVYEFAQSKGGHTIVGCKLLNVDGSVQNSFSDFPTPFNSFTSNFFLYKLFPKTKCSKYNQYNRGLFKIMEVDIVIGAFMFCLTEDLRMLNGFDERFSFYSEEIDLCYRFKKNIGKIFYYPDTSIVHLGGATLGRVQWFQYKNKAWSYIKYYQKHYSGVKYFIAVGSHFAGLLLRVPLSFLAGVFTLKKYYFHKAVLHFRQLFVYPKNVFN